ncbi:hypothetical protein OTU49_002545 [Cherax quadricarinatus]|uniref:Uncharacterized protein n=1 Tax=Cherax quadricarinatus TaxID=27406 RepID=A0AAW0YCK1_CHEQU|nr:uncharacterized protein LOC128706530 isoform X1 [Cherax quadricarinatus]
MVYPRLSLYNTSTPGNTMTSMTKVAEEVRELYLSKFEQVTPYICNAMSPRVLLLRLNSHMIEQYTKEIGGKTEPFMSEEEDDWFSAVPDDWENDNKDWNMSLLEPIVQISDESNSRQVSKRKRGSRGFGKKRGDHLSGSEDLDRQSPVDEVPVKQEKPDSPEHMVEIPPDMTMNMLPNVPAYPPSLPVFPLVPSMLPLYMAQQHTASGLQDANGHNVTTIHDNPMQPGEETRYAHDNVEANIKQEIPDSENPDQVIAMPFQSELRNDDSCLMSRDMVPSPLSTMEDFSDQRERKKKELTANMGHKSLRELTNLLVKLNNKNLQCDERIQMLKEEYDRKVAVIEAEKKANEKELDSVLSLIQNWKEGSKGESSAGSKKSRKNTEK